MGSSFLVKSFRRFLDASFQSLYETFFSLDLTSKNRTGIITVGIPYMVSGPQFVRT